MPIGNNARRCAVVVQAMALSRVLVSALLCEPREYPEYRSTRACVTHRIRRARLPRVPCESARSTGGGAHRTARHGTEFGARGVMLVRCCRVAHNTPIYSKPLEDVPNCGADNDLRRAEAGCGRNLLGHNRRGCWPALRRFCGRQQQLRLWVCRSSRSRLSHPAAVCMCACRALDGHTDDVLGWSVFRRAAAAADLVVA